MSGTICPTCERASVPRDQLRDWFNIDSVEACHHLIERDDGKHLQGLSTHHPAALVRALAQALIEALNPKRNPE